MSFLSALTLIFIILKLTGYIDWNWFFVILPLVIWFLVTVVIQAQTEYKRRSRRNWK